MPFMRRRDGSEDLDLYYEIRGSAGPQLLMFNGSGATIAGAGPLVDILARSCQVLIHDQRCLGRSTVPARQPTMADYAADGAALLDHVGWDRACIFGISFGGMVAQEFAVTFPGRVEKLALFCTSPGGAGGSSFPLHELPALTREERAKVSLSNLDTRFTPQWLDAHPADKALVDMMAAGSIVEKSQEQVRGEAMQLEARRHHDVWDRLHLVGAPTFIGFGRYDGLAPPANSAAIHSRIAQSELHGYEGGHLFAAQDRRAFTDVATFFAS